MRLSSLLTLGLLACLCAIPACSDNSTALKPSPTAQPSGEIQRIEKKSQVHKFEGYVFELPVRFKSVETGDTSLPRNIKMISFTAPAGNVESKTPQESFMAVRMSDEKAVAEMRKAPRQALVNFSAGVSDGQGLKVLQRGELRPQRIGDQVIYVMPIVLSNNDGTEILGLAAASAGKDHSINIMYMGFSGDHVENAKEIESCLGTFEYEVK